MISWILRPPFSTIRTVSSRSYTSLQSSVLPSNRVPLTRLYGRKTEISTTLPPKPITETVKLSRKPAPQFPLKSTAVVSDSPTKASANQECNTTTRSISPTKYLYTLRSTFLASGDLSDIAWSAYLQLRNNGLNHLMTLKDIKRLYFVLTRFRKDRNKKRIVDIYDDLKILGVDSRLQTLDGSMTPHVYQYVIEAFAALNLTKNLQIVLTEMKSKSVEMTIPSYGIVMKYYLRKDMNADVVQLFKEFVGKGNRKPSDEMLTAVLKAYFATNDTHSATELFQTVIQFKELPPITTFFNEYMDGLINSNNTASALDTYDVMRSLSVDPDIQTINILIKAYTSIGNISSAYKLFKSLPSQYQHLRANVITYTTLITGLLTDSINMKLAESLLQEMTTLGIQPTVQTFTTFIHGYLSKKKTLKAFEMYQKMVDEHRIKPNVVTFTTLIKYFADLHEEGAGQRCWQIYTDMISRKVKPDIAVLTVLLKRFIKDGNDEGIKTVIDERKRWKVKADDRFDNVIAWYNGAKKE